MLVYHRGVKLLLTLAAFLFLSVLAALRARKGRRDVSLLESGKLCVHCGGTNVQPSQRGIVCMSCGQTTSWGIATGTSLTEAEIDAMHEPTVKPPFGPR